jgi:hypothetical protein
MLVTANVAFGPLAVMVIVAVASAASARQTPYRATADSQSPTLAWPATYNMSQSTISNPDGNYTGYDAGLLLQRDAQYGIILRELP